MKIRLWRGPLDGRVVVASFGNVAIVSGPKKMSRKKLAEWRHNQEWRAGGMGFYVRGHRPMVECEYRRVTLASNFPSMHPDGSVFYEYVRTIREY